MSSRRSWKAASSAAVGLLAWSLAGCGETETPPAAPNDAAAVKNVAAVEPPKVAKGKGKKQADPTAEMGLRELREYKRQMREQGKTP